MTIPAQEPRIPPALAEKVRLFQGGRGIRRLRALPRKLEALASRWKLEIGEPFDYESLSYVAAAMRETGEKAVLKVELLRGELKSEIAALRFWNGGTAVRLLEADERMGALLLERLEPGDCLVGVPEDEACSIAASVMRGLWKPPPSRRGFPEVTGWCKGFGRLREFYGGGTGPFPALAVETAERLAQDLASERTGSMLLHGDLHHFNVLRAERLPWVAIDPKGVVGDPAFEVGPFLANEWQSSADPAALAARRLDAFASELGIERRRLRAWALVHAVLSAWWGVEDQGSCSESALFHIQTIASLG